MSASTSWATSLRVGPPYLIQGTLHTVCRHCPALAELLYHLSLTTSLVWWCESNCWLAILRQPRSNADGTHHGITNCRACTHFQRLLASSHTPR